MATYDEATRTTIFTAEEKAAFAKSAAESLKAKMDKNRAECPRPDDDKWMWERGMHYVCTVLEFRSKYAYVDDAIANALKWDTEREAYEWLVPQLDRAVTAAIDHAHNISLRHIRAELRLKQLREPV